MSDANPPLLDIHLFAKQGELDEVKKIVKKDPEMVHAKSKHGDVPLHLAVDAGEIEVVDYLLSKGGELNDRTKYGRSPLHRSAWKGQLEMAKFLVGKGAELNSQDIYGNTPLDTATSKELRLYLREIGCMHGSELESSN